MRLFQLFLTCLIVSFTISCEKKLDDQTDVNNLTIEELQDQFFDVGFLERNNPNVHSTTGINTRSTDPLITEIMADMQLAEYETAYINELIDHLGFPAWNHAEVVPHDGNEEIAVLPFAHVEGSSISGVLLATRKENGMKYRLIDKGAMLQIGRQYSDHSFYLASLLYLAHMDKVVFDEVECQLAAMLNAASSNLVEEGIITVRSCYTVTVFWERCVRWLIHVASEDDPEGGYFYEDETCTTYPVTITVCESDAQDILGTATPGDDYFVPPPHTDPPENTNPYGSNPEPNNTLIKKLLNLTEEEADCFNTLPLDVRESLLIDVMSNSITDPCDPSLTTGDIVSESIKAACRDTSSILDEEGFYEALGEEIMSMIEKCFPQNSPYSQSNECEKELIGQHPPCAWSIAENWIVANALTHQYMGSNGPNDCSDAFRHTFFNALNALSCNVSLAREFGEARECTSGSQMGTEMDLHNNEIGYMIISQNPQIADKWNTDIANLHHEAINELVSIICNELTLGSMLIFADPTVIDEEADNGGTYLLDSDDCNCLP